MIINGEKKRQRRRTRQDFIDDATEIHKGFYDYSLVEFHPLYSVEKVTIVCPIHGPFLQAPWSHLQGSGCRQCNSKIVTTEEFIRRSNEAHGDTYDYSETIYTKLKDRVKVKCPDHGIFEVTASLHMRGGGKCPSCRGVSEQSFIEQARAVHGDRYDYSQLGWKNKTTDVTVVCPEHGPFTQKPIHHLQGSGCSVCSGYRKGTAESFIEDAREIHKDKYDYSLVEYKRRDRPVKIICPKHGEFEQTPYNHLQGYGCGYCSGTKKLTQQDFETRARSAHGDYYDLSKAVYVRGDNKVDVICPVHGEFSIGARRFMEGQGCRQCWLDRIGKRKRELEEIAEKERYERNRTREEEKRKAREAPDKFCKRCEQVKPKSEFRDVDNAFDGSFSICKQCEIEKRREHWKNLSPEQKQKKYDRSSRRIGERMRTDNEYRVMKLARQRLNDILRTSEIKKKRSSSIKLLGCNKAKLWEYLNSLGYDPEKDAVDHVIPLARFDLNDERVQTVAFHYLNLQPLDRIENMSKGAKLLDGWRERLDMICEAVGEDYEYILLRMDID